MCHNTGLSAQILFLFSGELPVLLLCSSSYILHMSSLLVIEITHVPVIIQVQKSSVLETSEAKGSLGQDNTSLSLS